MPLPRVRFTVRRMMIATAAAGVVVWALKMTRLAADYHERAALNARREELVWQSSYLLYAKTPEEMERKQAEKDRSLRLHAAYYAGLRAKYERAARYPFLPVAPDPPGPDYGGIRLRRHGLPASIARPAASRGYLPRPDPRDGVASMRGTSRLMAAASERAGPITRKFEFLSRSGKGASVTGSFVYDQAIPVGTAGGNVTSLTVSDPYFSRLVETPLTASNPAGIGVDFDGTSLSGTFTAAATDGEFVLFADGQFMTLAGHHDGGINFRLTSLVTTLDEDRVASAVGLL